MYQGWENFVTRLKNFIYERKNLLGIQSLFGRFFNKIAILFVWPIWTLAAAPLYVLNKFRFLNVPLSVLGLIKKVFALLIALTIGFFVSYLFFFQEEEIYMLVLFPVTSVTSYFSLSSLFNSRFFYKKILRINHIEDFKNAVQSFYEKKFFYNDIPDLKQTINSIFEKELNISSVQIILLEETGENKFSNLINHFKKDKNFYFSAEDPYLSRQESIELRELGKLCFPVWGRSDTLVGLFVLGEKPHNSIYSKEEIELLKAASFHISLALRILNYNKDIRAEVAEKTMQLRAQAKELQQSYHKLKNLDEAKDSFFAVTSHDLRTPMTIIKGYSDFLLSGKFGELNEKQRDFIRKIFDSSNNLLSLINSILDLSKLEAGRMEFHFSHIKIIQFLEEVISDFKLMCENKKITLNLLNPDKIKLKIKTDPDKLKRVFTNLLGNAYKFTPENGEINVKVEHDKEDSEFLRFEVKDSGIGIPKDQLGMIFEKFTQVENFLQKTYNGTGLGLSIVQKIIRKLGGKIWVESEKNKGSNFIFLIPIKNE